MKTHHLFKGLRKNLAPHKVLLLLFLTLPAFLIAKENPKRLNPPVQQHKRTADLCSPASSSVELNVNNVRCLLHNGGDMWWDLVNNPRYEVPKVKNPVDAKHSAFAASLWIGGVDEQGIMRVAAQTYRQTGNDFFPGPLSMDGKTIDEVTCKKWDNHYKITKVEIDAFRAARAAQAAGGPAVKINDFPNIKNWPAFGQDSEFNTIALAPFVDVDGNSLDYNPEGGDYPDIRPVEGGGEPDMAIWWVINDKGNIHSETGGEPIGLEIQMMAFAFTTANAVNDMTFYKYSVFNKSGRRLNDTYLGQWVDVDVGNPQDDYVGCDTVRGLGFGFNADDNDETPSGYGTNPPAFGMDFFQGPKGNNGDRIGMSRFVYYQNDFSLLGNPENATQFYGYLKGLWKDGSDMRIGGTGHGGNGPVTKYMFPGDGGWCGPTSGWSEVTSQTPPGDRRFLQTAGPFTLENGARNDIITGAVWARGYYRDNLGSVCELQKADDVAQALFDNNFLLLDGPDAPEVAIAEYNRELLISWGYGENTRHIRNNFNETYIQSDPVLIALQAPDPYFEFEGYILYQLKNGSVSITDLNNSDLARIVAQCDIENQVSTIVNRSSSIVPGQSAPIIMDEVMVNGQNEGIFNSVRVSEDLFASGGDKRLINYKTYHFGVLAYAHNDTASDGQKFLQGNRYFDNITAIPHKIGFEQGGLAVAASYGDGLALTQVAGIGNGGRFVYFDGPTETEIMANNWAPSVSFIPSFAPVDIKVTNPKEIHANEYKLEYLKKVFSGESDTIELDGNNIALDSTFIEWILYQKEGNNWSKVYASSFVKRLAGSAISFRPPPSTVRERVIEGHGFSISVANSKRSGLVEKDYDPVIGASILYENEQNRWLDGWGDDDSFENWNWIQSGEDAGDNQFTRLEDPEENYEKLIGKSWAPACLSKRFTTNSDAIGPGIPIGFGGTASFIHPNQILNLDEIHDVDIVMTSNKDLWSRCVVVETSTQQELGSGAMPLSARWELSVDKSGNPEAGILSKSTQGMSWFPGYALDLTTGERLNIFFGENSWDKKNHGGDMLFNPTRIVGASGEKVGGRHFVYVHASRYDECAAIRQVLSTGTTSSGSGFLSRDANNIGDVYKDMMWIGLPKPAAGFEFILNPGLIPGDARISLRANKPFDSRVSTNDHPIFTFTTDELAAEIGRTDLAEKSVMECIQVVPNPYYGGSQYERSQIQNKIKFTNLPQQCTIRIFTLNGTLIRSYKKDSDEPNQDWDLKNQAGVPIASGVYLIHIDAGDLGERVLKWFGVIRQIDLASF